jgi:hypothetical protein
VNVLIGILVVGLGILGIAASCWGGWFLWHDDQLPSRPLAILTAVGGTLVSLIFVVLGFALVVQSDGPTFMEGACYRAVARNSYIPVNTGKVTVIIPVSDVDLVEIMCP